ncbi:MAG: type II secretion system protein M [Alteromonadaceae bacterium]|jgi:general secretion pathway protein M|uniref:Type II secretion system protein M n=2 Tax=Paraglaciecola mesophila TaxID=197222 RepID=K6Z154_9ALTE|nr:type II secretion system protein M [Paraglaciecola mesophila]MAD18279.1 type II secretion system protein M [Alteromonadaceae bacterium]MBB20924.1 type II secretion system protein M [Rickettsiales bacterium]GAC24142.1 general secretion pathway protein M [Paraglaciecola mesophila KMM 241]|tara:strand:- start:4356 stop:4835 length:480 start_codon:yes stop_codon:yes gene_type:complete
MNTLKQKFSQLTEREQRLVLISAVVVVVGMFYWLVWSPLNQAIERDQKALDSQKSLLSWVQKNANRAIQLRAAKGVSAGFNGSLAQAANQTAANANIPIARMQPQGDELQVWVDQAPFNGVLDWLKSLEEMGVSILDLDIAEADAPGQVKIRRLKLGKS